MRPAIGIVGIALVLLATGAAQAQAQPVTPGFDGVQVVTQPDEVRYERAGFIGDAARTVFCAYEPVLCMEDKKKPKGASFWRKARSLAKCAMRIGGFVAGNYFAITKLKKSGGVWKVAKKAWSTKGRTGKIQVLMAAIGELAGIEEVADGCGM